MRWRPILAPILAGAVAVLLIVQTAHSDTTGNWGSTARVPGTASPIAPAVGVHVVGGVNPADTSFVPEQFNSSGWQKVGEQAPAMDANLTFASIISRDSLSMGQADSSAILDTHRMRLGMLLIKPYSGTGTTGTVDTTCIYRIAVQIRTHLNGGADSSNTFAVYPYGVAAGMNQTAVSTAADTAAQGHLYDNATLGTYIPSNVINAWSGEITVFISAQRFAYGASIAVNGNTFYYPNGIAIPLSSLYGRDIYSPYTSVRVRLLTVQKGAAELSTARIGLQVHLVGTPL